jgi:hypothetical protein
MHKKLKIGDKVRFLNEPISGVVSSVVNSSTIQVSTSDGFDIHVDVSQVIVVNQQTDNALLEKKISEDEPMIQVLEHKPELQIQILQSVDSQQIIEISLYNTSSFNISIVLSGLGVQHQTYAQASLKTGEYKVLEKLSLLEQDTWPKEWTIQVIFHPYQSYFYPPFHSQFKLNPTKLLKAQQGLSPSNQKGYSIELSPIQYQQSSVDVFEEATRKKVSYHFKPGLEVDLHAEALGLTEMKINPNEYLSKQMGHFKMCVDAAIVHEYPQIVFIHGVGNGVLRDAIYLEAKNYPQILAVETASPLKYGNGACLLRFGY